MTLGYPFAVDAEYVNIVPRAFRGYVITRRELLHVQPAQPTGYELSFPTPKGTSGAPLLGGGPSALTCRGYIIQQTTLGGSDDGMIAGLAVASMAWLSLHSEMLGRPLAAAFDWRRSPGKPSSAGRW